MIEGIITILKIFGYIKLIELIYRFIWMVQRHFRTTDGLADRYGKGSWAVVTGGNDGIGYAMCSELAKCGFNIVMIARRPTNMQ
jgi:17beta-estradiol 17-dehydrogenase / very-long-chain 3-oxoacyl-CoA reductase